MGVGVSSLTILTPELNAALIGFVVALLAYITNTLKTKLANIQKEVTPNHGSSARDAIDRTEGLSSDILSAIKDMRKDVGGIRRELRDLHRTDELIRETAETDHAELRRLIELTERTPK